MLALTLHFHGECLFFSVVEGLITADRKPMEIIYGAYLLINLFIKALLLFPCSITHTSTVFVSRVTEYCVVLKA